MKMPTSGLPFSIRFTDFCPWSFAFGSRAPDDIDPKTYFTRICAAIPTTPGLSAVIEAAQRWWKLEAERRARFLHAYNTAPATVKFGFKPEDRVHEHKRAEFFRRLKDYKQPIAFAERPQTPDFAPRQSAHNLERQELAQRALIARRALALNPHPKVVRAA